MTHRALKRRPPWLQLPERRALRRPLPWLILLALLMVLGGVTLIARFALFLASPDLVRYAGDLSARTGADYRFWPIGPLIPPLNPEVIEAAQAEEAPLPPEPSGPQDAVPIAVVGVSTSQPVATATPSPSPSPSPSATVATAQPPTASVQASSPTATRTVVVQQAPTNPPPAPARTAAPSATAAPPTTTPVTAPVPPAPTSTRQPSPTSTQAPPVPTSTQTPAPATATPPVAGTPVPPTATSTPSPTATPEPPRLAFANVAPIVGEADRSVLVYIRLNKAFDQAVSVAYATGDGGARAGLDYASRSGTLTIAVGATEGFVEVPILTDSLDERNETFTLTLSNPVNAIPDGAQVATVTITDGTAPPTLRFTGSARSVDESVGSAAVTIELSAASAIDVSVPYRVGIGGSAAGLADHGLRDGTAIIPAGATSARLRFPIVDDEVDEDNEPITIYLGTPANAQLGAPSIYALTIVDDDTAGVTISPRQFNLAEGGAGASYSVVLESQPVADVVITLAPDAQVAVSPAQLTFTPASWKTPQSVSLSAIQDFVDEASPHAGRVSHGLSSADPRYNNLVAPVVNAAIADDDTANVVVEVAEVPLKLSEDPGAFDHRRSYSVVLESQPVAPVTVAIVTDGQVTANRAALLFTAANWNQKQTVLLTAVDDFVDEEQSHPSLITHVATSDDAIYNGIAVPSVSLMIADNDTAGLLVSPETLTVSESPVSLIHRRPYTLRLESQPTANVMVEVSFDSMQIESVAPVELLFTPANWNIPQPVMVEAKDDQIDEVDLIDGVENTLFHRSLITHTIVSADPNYREPTAPFTPGSVEVMIFDDDFAGVRITPASEKLDVAEGGTVTYTVQLETEPLADVSVAIDPLDEGLFDAVVPVTLTFTPATWNITQTVTITAVNNFVDTPDAQTTISHVLSSADPLYDTPVPPFVEPTPVVSVTIIDDDTAGVLVTPTSLNLGEPEAANDAGGYEVRLTSEPTAPVTLTLDLDSTQLVASTASLVFTPASWNEPQSVTIGVVDDAIDEDAQTRVITHSVASADGVYAGLSPAVLPAVTVNIADNDEAGVVFDPSSLTLSESVGGTNPHSATVGVRLQSQPTAPVTVTLAPDAQLTIDPAILVFDPLLWDQPQAVSLTAVDDFVDETTPHTGTLAVSAASADPFYQRAFDGSLVVIEDDDTAGVTLGGPSGLVTSESGGAITFTLRLDSQPLAPVALDVTSDTPTEGVVSSPPLPLVFDAATWNITRTVTVTGVDDLLADGSQPYQVRVAVAAGSDAAYAALTPGALPVIDLINQDDEPALVDVGDPAVLSEGDTGLRALRFSVTLRRPAVAPVAIDYTTVELDALAGSDFQPLAGTLTLAPGELSGNIDVFVIGDTAYEPDERFGVRLIAATATGELTGLGDAEAIGVIRNDDAIQLRFATGDFLVTENVGTASIEVRLDAPVEDQVTVGYSTIDSGALAGSATVGADYLGASGELVFAPGEVVQTIQLTVIDDDLQPEPRYETVRLSLLPRQVGGVQIGQPDTASLTIEEDGGATPFGEPGFLATAGPQAEMIHGYWYTSAAAGSGSDYLQLMVPCSWPAGQPLTVELWSAAIHTDPDSPDIALEPGALAAPDTTNFELYDAGTVVGLDGRSPAPGAPGSLFAQTFQPTDVPADWAPFFTVADPQPCGRYVLRSATSDDDENSWAVRASLSGADPVRFATLLNTVEQSSARGVQACRTAWFAVPAGANELLLRNFDLDTARDQLANLRYYAPGQAYDAMGRIGGLVGTESGEARWAEDRIAQPAAGWWRAVICTSGRNLHGFDVQADGVLLPVQYDTPLPAPELEVAVAFTPASVAQGEATTLNVSYVVAGASPARAVVFTLELTSELTFAGEPCASIPWPCSRAGNRLTLAAGDLAAGASGSFALPVQVAAGLAPQRAAALLSARYTDTFGVGGGAEASALLAIQ